MTKHLSTTTVSAAVRVLQDAGRPLTVGEIWARIQKSGSWQPPRGGTSPRRTLAVQMARASQGYAGSRPTRAKRFRRLDNGRYKLLR